MSTTTATLAARRGVRLGAAALVLLATAGGLAACTGSGSSGSTPSSAATSTAAPTASPSSSAGVVAPIIVAFSDVDGTTVTVPLGNTLVLTSDTEPLADWSADGYDTAVLRFSPGSAGGSADFNPGFETLKVGSTPVTMTNSSTGTSVSFTVDVTG